MAKVSAQLLLCEHYAHCTSWVVNVTVHSSTGSPSPVEVIIYEGGSNSTVVTSQNGNSDEPFQFAVSSPKLWSPDSPNLYNITVKLGSDKISSYTGFRTISKGKVDGIVRPLLNGEFIFQFGTLDQGFWPDGVYTPPNREAMIYDLQVLKKLGFNSLRKHVSVMTISTRDFANISRLNRSKLKMLCSIKHVIKWVSFSSKTCPHFDLSRARPCPITHRLPIYRMRISKLSSLANSSSL
jgi:hypothetical protein